MTWSLMPTNLELRFEGGIIARNRLCANWGCRQAPARAFTFTIVRARSIVSLRSCGKQSAILELDGDRRTVPDDHFRSFEAAPEFWRIATAGSKRRRVQSIVRR